MTLARTSSHAPRATSALHVASRVGASLAGGYAFVWGFVSLGIVVGVALGMPYPEAQALLHLLAFLVFLSCFLWAFVAPRAARVWAVLAGGGALMTGAAWLLSQSVS